MAAEIIQIQKASTQFIDQLGELIKSNDQSIYRYLPKSKFKEQTDRIIVNEIVDLLDTPNCVVFASIDSNNLLGLIVCEELPWDSRVLQGQWKCIKYLMASSTVEDRNSLFLLLINELFSWVKKCGTDCIVMKSSSDNIAVTYALESSGFHLMDTNLVYVMDFTKNPFEKISPPPLPQDALIRLATNTDKNELLEIARVAFQGHFSRYMVDSHITKNIAQNVYVEWMRSCIDGYADWIVVAEIDHRIAGYTIWKKASIEELNHNIRLGHFSIAGIHPNFAGRGLFSALTYAGMSLLHTQVDYIEGPTHINNYPVQQGYHKLGWKIVDARHSFHKWLND